eukprot:1462264-Pyramimonas_sp.AAC.1
MGTVSRAAPKSPFQSAVFQPQGFPAPEASAATLGSTGPSFGNGPGCRSPCVPPPPQSWQWTVQAMQRHNQHLHNQQQIVG